MELFERARAELIRSNADRKHPFRYFCLATFGSFPEARTVVNRGVGPEELSILLFTDARTPKVAQARANPRVSALFYHPKQQLQVRLYGMAELIDRGAEEYDQLLQRVKQSGNLKDYTTEKPPGSEAEAISGAILGDDVHFLAIRIRPVRMDVLQLGRDRHHRSVYNREDGGWTETVLVP